MDDFFNNQSFCASQDLPSFASMSNPDIQQGYDDTCAIKSQEIILRDFGVEIPEDVLRGEAMERGWYNAGGGTPVSEVGNLLELHGVGVEKYDNASVEDLVKCLAEGKQIIVGVDSGELWEGGADEALEDVFAEQADHALIVAGIDTTDPLHPQVVLTDPGNGKAAAHYPLEQFENAWRDSGNYMVVTENPAPLTAAGMENFDYEEGHIREVCGMDYDDWVAEHSDKFSLPSYQSADLDGDGIVETRMHDINHDGIMDVAEVDLDGDGLPDIRDVSLNDESTQLAAQGDGYEVMDLDGDGKPDSMAVDVNGDGQSDLIASDMDGDGIIDTTFTDMNGDGRIDGSSILGDFNGDGIQNEVASFIDTNGDGLVDTGIIQQADGSMDIAMDLDGDGLADAFDHLDA